MTRLRASRFLPSKPLAILLCVLASFTLAASAAAILIDPSGKLLAAHMMGVAARCCAALAVIACMPRRGRGALVHEEA